VTFAETAAAMRRCADAIDKVVREQGRDCDTRRPKPMLTEEAAAGAACLLCYLRDLVTAGEREQYDRPSLLVILETISRDPEIFPCGVGQVIWNAEDNEEDEQ
jgi:hypothetical protein